MKYKALCIIACSLISFVSQASGEVVYVPQLSKKPVQPVVSGPSRAQLQYAHDHVSSSTVSGGVTPVSSVSSVSDVNVHDKGALDLRSSNIVHDEATKQAHDAGVQSGFENTDASTSIEVYQASNTKALQYTNKRGALRERGRGSK